MGEFAFQVEILTGATNVHEKARKRCERFFISLQNDVKDWISLGTTKTGSVYRLKGECTCKAMSERPASVAARI